MNKTMVSSKNVFLHSKSAEDGAEQLIKDIKSGKMRRTMSPNNTSDFTGNLGHEDYKSFCTFLLSINGKILLEQIEKNDID